MNDPSHAATPDAENDSRRVERDDALPQHFCSRCSTELEHHSDYSESKMTHRHKLIYGNIGNIRCPFMRLRYCQWRYFSLSLSLLYRWGPCAARDFEARVSRFYVTLHLAVLIFCFRHRRALCGHLVRCDNHCPCYLVNNLCASVSSRFPSDNHHAGCTRVASKDRAVSSVAQQPRFICCVDLASPGWVKSDTAYTSLCLRCFTVVLVIAMVTQNTAACHHWGTSHAFCGLYTTSHVLSWFLAITLFGAAYAVYRRAVTIHGAALVPRPGPPPLVAAWRLSDVRTAKER
ncbi:hypothetical protein B0H10DRAFT_2118966 [Mycena sp. CBHHK59/15]|nr:hypothetical protein B0H10DRAFT_2118966 [Mycena sp. CBHHK59/15]